ncbi:predicted protein [Streptomyces sp. C]|nr:predicted protein [Streptomyces sp. C]
MLSDGVVMGGACAPRLSHTGAGSRPPHTPLGRFRAEVNVAEIVALALIVTTTVRVFSSDVTPTALEGGDEQRWGSA